MLSTTRRHHHHCGMWQVFTPLEYGCCGLSEEDAEKRVENQAEYYEDDNDND